MINNPYTRLADIHPVRSGVLEEKIKVCNYLNIPVVKNHHGAKSVYKTDAPAVQDYIKKHGFIHGEPAKIPTLKESLAALPLEILLKNLAAITEDCRRRGINASVHIDF